MEANYYTEINKKGKTLDIKFRTLGLSSKEIRITIDPDSVLHIKSEVDPFTFNLPPHPGIDISIDIRKLCESRYNDSYVKAIGFEPLEWLIEESTGIGRIKFKLEVLETIRVQFGGSYK